MSERFERKALLQAGTAAVLLHAWGLHVMFAPPPQRQQITAKPAPALEVRQLPSQITAEQKLQTKAQTKPQTNAQAPTKPSQTPIFKTNSPLVTESIESAAIVFEIIPAPMPPTNFAPAQRQSAWPAPMQLSYSLQNSVQSQRADMPFAARPARATLAWTHDNGSYSLNLQVERWFGGPRSLHSTGSVGEAGLQPLRYSERGGPGGPERRGGEQAVHFNTELQRLVYSNNRPDAALESGMQDRLSTIMQISAWLAANPQQVLRSKTLTLPTTGLSGTSNWEFVVEQLGEGSAVTAKLSSTARHDFDNRWELWFAQSQAWLPVRLRISRPNGDFMLLELAQQSLNQQFQVK